MRMNHTRSYSKTFEEAFCAPSMPTCHAGVFHSSFPRHSLFLHKNHHHDRFSFTFRIPFASQNGRLLLHPIKIDFSPTAISTLHLLSAHHGSHPLTNASDSSINCINPDTLDPPPPTSQPAHHLITPPKLLSLPSIHKLPPLSLSKTQAKSLPLPADLPLFGILLDSLSIDIQKLQLDLIILHHNLSKHFHSFSLPLLQKFTSKKLLLASKQGFRLLLSLPSSSREQKQGMAVFEWLHNLGRIYGPSLMVLVGLGYWIQGFRCFPWLAVNFYFKDVLIVDPGTLQIVQNTVNLPMVAKPVYGIVSDAVYIRGAHRVPYLVIGGSLQVLSWSTIAFLPGDGSSMWIIAIFLALSNLGASMVDVANDALVAECANKKKSSGELQSFAWFATAAGGVLGNLIAAFALSRVEFKTMFGVFGVLVLLQVAKSIGVNEKSFGLKMPHAMINGEFEKRNDYSTDFPKLPKKRAKLPSMVNGSDVSSIVLTMESTEDEGWRHTGINLAEINVDEEFKIPRIRQQFTDLFQLVKEPEILYPLAWFMGSYAMIPTLAGTMFFYQTQHLKINPLIVGLAKVLGQVGLMGGSVVYSRYLKSMPLRKLLGAIQILLSVCMLFDILLVKRINVELGIPDAALVLGASAFVDAINQFKMLPFMVLLAQLCPAGSEGSLLAAFMSIQCLATIISGYMGVSLASALHISGSDFSELPTGILVQAMAALLPLLWISFIPDQGSKLQQPREGKRVTTALPALRSITRNHDQ